MQDKGCCPLQAHRNAVITFLAFFGKALKAKHRHKTQGRNMAHTPPIFPRVCRSLQWWVVSYSRRTLSKATVSSWPFSIRLRSRCVTLMKQMLTQKLALEHTVVFQTKAACYEKRIFCACVEYFGLQPQKHLCPSVWLIRGNENCVLRFCHFLCRTESISRHFTLLV